MVQVLVSGISKAGSHTALVARSKSKCENIKYVWLSAPDLVRLKTKQKTKNQPALKGWNTKGHTTKPTAKNRMPEPRKDNKVSHPVCRRKWKLEAAGPQGPLWGWKVGVSLLVTTPHQRAGLLLIPSSLLSSTPKCFSSNPQSQAFLSAPQRL